MKRKSLCSSFLSFSSFVIFRIGRKSLMTEEESGAWGKLQYTKLEPQYNQLAHAAEIYGSGISGIDDVLHEMDRREEDARSDRPENEPVRT
ncbi:MAG: hypothetical protein ACSW8A_01805 [Lachnospiraceae bacterium]